MCSGGTGTDDGNESLMARIEASVPHPRIGELMFFSEPARAPEDIVEEALAYRPIEL
jgi:hypothetical protein